MKTHFENLEDHISNLRELKILDLGSGKGDFLIEGAKRGAKMFGLEYNPSNIDITIEKAKKEEVQINIKQGVAEDLPFGDNEFDFINICEVYEHVFRPLLLLKEVNRVLKPFGKAYLSVPNRYGFYDPHFHIYFINWFPRNLAFYVIGLLGKHKDYSTKSGLQDIRKMNYATFGEMKRELEKLGFGVSDMRLNKIKKILPKYLKPIFVPVYLMTRNFYWSTMHLEVYKK